MMHQNIKSIKLKFLRFWLTRLQAVVLNKYTYARTHVLHMHTCMRGVHSDITQHGHKQEVHMHNMATFFATIL